MALHDNHQTPLVKKLAACPSVHMTALPFSRIFIFKQMSVTWFISLKPQEQEAEKEVKVSAKCSVGQAASRPRQEELEIF